MITLERAVCLFDIEQRDWILILTPVQNLREADCEQMRDAAGEVLELLEREPIDKVILDFSKTDYFGSTALAFFVKLWKLVSIRQGQMAFCNVSAHEKEILRSTRLDELWPICSNREEALRVIKTGKSTVVDKSADAVSCHCRRRQAREFFWGILGGLLGSLAGFTAYDTTGALVGGLLGILLFENAARWLFYPKAKIPVRGAGPQKK